MIVHKLNRYLFELTRNDEPDILSLEELVKLPSEELVDLIEGGTLDTELLDEIQDMIDAGILDIEEEIKSKRTSISKKSYANKYYRVNKKTVLSKKKKLDQSGEGKTRKRMKPILKKGRKTPTGQHKRENNV